MVGVTGLELSRDDFFKKELTFQVSASYGPGRYDPNYEEKGQDYPIGFVRWTEQRNFEAVLDMMEMGKLDVKPLISHRFDIADAEKAYELVGGSAPSLGILLRYPGIEITQESRTMVLEEAARKSEASTSGDPVVSFLGAGNYARKVLIPAFSAAGVSLRGLGSKTGVSGVHAGRKFGFDKTTTGVDSLFEDAGANAMVIATRHDSHAAYVLKALAAGKHVFVEKPLCLSLEELSEIDTAYEVAGKGSTQPIAMVGFNRRFAPQIRKVKDLLEGFAGPKSFVMTVNAGAIPGDHWTQDIGIGGGRIIGEACHFIDLLRFLAGVPISGYQNSTMGHLAGDTATLQLSFADGSIGTIHYFANGSKSFP